MLKKSIALCLLSSTLLAGIAFSQDFMFVPSVPNQADTQDKTTEIMQEAQVSTPNTPAPVQLDRSGVDRASVHLQILQQSNLRFADTPQTTPATTQAPAAKKTAADEKKSQAKSNSSS